MDEENNINNTDENNQDNKQAKNITDNKTKHNSIILKFVLIMIVIFLGTFAAVYTIVDMTMYKLGFRPFFSIANQIEKAFDEDEAFLEKNSPAPVKIETKNDKYILTVNMKAFDNKEENFDIDIKDNGITIKGEYKSDKKDEIKQNSFYQNVILPNKIDESNVTKEVKGNKIIITLPLAQKNNNP